jgi:hypothetical protein
MVFAHHGHTSSCTRETISREHVIPNTTEIVVRLCCLVLWFEYEMSPLKTHGLEAWPPAGGTILKGSGNLGVGELEEVGHWEQVFGGVLFKALLTNFLSLSLGFPATMV